ncbi:hypothetical protein AMAG_15636 [Allomyces macrogynus ATCC 38327]|uniref:Barwin domain-containing protein n=1 Tax=Allomyces macrogynus (strain ATCC 38327) TaxID=578462 RepID=A0A0L0T9J6_ALLM3|nr:hypothetical protein AMAG_15636 [Allomyces macrogynus ATCC 38327]|eukprot:KNE71401.1 hypothetical protein AMAG_15636 [Allomyces macrogynus ATCC 38327]
MSHLVSQLVLATALLAAFASAAPSSPVKSGTARLASFGDVSPALVKRGLASGRGEGTYYDVGLGACESTNSNSELVVALNAPDFGPAWPPRSSAACTSCLAISSPENPSAGTVVVRIVDKCPGCKAGDLDMSPAVFTKFFPEGKGRFNIEWKAVQCGGGSPAPAPAPAPVVVAKPAPQPTQAPAPPAVVVVTKQHPRPFRRSRRPRRPPSQWS